MVDSVLWYIHRQAYLSMITNTLYNYVFTCLHNKLCITLCVCSPSHPYLVSSLFTPSLYSLFLNFFFLSQLSLDCYEVINVQSIYNKCPELAPKYIDEISLISSSELVCASYEPIYVPIIIYCLRPFVVVYKLVIFYVDK